MAYKFTEKTNNKQQQTTYVLYMIISSYFHKSICNNKVLETSLRLHYREMRESRQCSLEKEVIVDTERALKGILPVLSKMNCRVSIRRQDGEYHLRFETGFEAVSAVVNREGDYRIRVVDGTAGSRSVFA